MNKDCEHLIFPLQPLEFGLSILFLEFEISICDILSRCNLLNVWKACLPFLMNFSWRHSNIFPKQLCSTYVTSIGWDMERLWMWSLFLQNSSLESPVLVLLKSPSSETFSMSQAWCGRWLCPPQFGVGWKWWFLDRLEFEVGLCSWREEKARLTVDLLLHGHYSWKRSTKAE